MNYTIAHYQFNYKNIVDAIGLITILLRSMKHSKKGQAGWTTMEYVVGAFLLITVVASVVGIITQAISDKGAEVQNAIAN